jgi:hypothetical protein
MPRLAATSSQSLLVRAQLKVAIRRLPSPRRSKKRRSILPRRGLQTQNVSLRISGFGEEGLRILADIREEHGLKIVTEALDEAGVDLVEKYGDVIQIGARNMQNFSLLRRAGKARIPVLLKRGLSATLGEWLLAAEYVMAEGNYQIVLCERGIRTFAQHTRNTMDLAAIPAFVGFHIYRSSSIHLTELARTSWLHHGSSWSCRWC